VKIIFLKNQVSSLKCWEEPELMFLIKRERERERERENHPTLIYTLSLPQVPGCKKGRTSQDPLQLPPKCMEHFSIPKGDPVS
jgi:hypothetical protein